MNKPYETSISKSKNIDTLLIKYKAKNTKDLFMKIAEEGVKKVCKTKKIENEDWLAETSRSLQRHLFKETILIPSPIYYETTLYFMR